jgi:hypothetical protein
LETAGVLGAVRIDRNWRVGQGLGIGCRFSILLSRRGGYPHPLGCARQAFFLQGSPKEWELEDERQEFLDVATDGRAAGRLDLDVVRISIDPCQEHA